VRQATGPGSEVGIGGSGSGPEVWRSGPVTPGGDVVGLLALGIVTTPFVEDERPETVATEEDSSAG
jgi:hypothetical protein